ncbi:MAG: FAD-binding oxidoreductase [Gammaproteobacteria bacterium]|nr:FAD-binding oxidoreductase [Gammaproteobacteria bacterium]MDH3859859.1 FAD-binding oxidoreductase [Gammaproteobacteria bacterium]
MAFKLVQDRSDTADYPNSYYQASQNRVLELTPLDGSRRADVCVVGGGYTGLSSALHLAERGYDVVLLEARQPGWGASGRNGGQLCSGQRKDQITLTKMVGADAARQFWELAEAAKDLAKKIIADHRIDCDLKPGIAHPDHRSGYAKESEAYVDFLRRQYDYDQVEYLERDAMAELVGSDSYYGGSLDMGAGHLHPLNYALGLADAALAAGAKLYRSTIVESYQEGSPNRIMTNHGVVEADSIVLACNGYLGKLEQRLAGRIMPINNFVIATEPLGESLLKRINPRDVAIADSRFVVNYYRLSADKRMLFGGGENYRQNFPADIANFVRKPMLEIYPELVDCRIDYAWGGALAVTLNRMPHFGRLGQHNIYYAQGYSGQGVAMATLAGQLIADAIAGEAESFDLFGTIPTRAFPGGDLLRWPGLVLGMSYYALRDRF